MHVASEMRQRRLIAVSVGVSQLLVLRKLKELKIPKNIIASEY